MERNKIEYGISNLHIGEYIEDNGIVTLGEAMKIPGAISLSLDEKSDEVKIHADNIVYYSSYNESGETGDLNVTIFGDEFKEKFLGYQKLDDGGFAKIKGAKKPKAYLIFQAEGDTFNRRFIMYNVSFGSIKQDHKTVDDKIDADTEKISLSVVGDNETKIVKIGYLETDDIYDTIFENPPVPKLPEKIINKISGSSIFTFSKKAPVDVDINVTSNASANEIQSVKIGNKAVPAEKMTITGLKVKLSQTYLATLDIKNYNTVIALKKGKAVSATLKIVE